MTSNRSLPWARWLNMLRVLHPQRRHTCAQVLHRKRTGNVYDGYDIALLFLNEPSTKDPIMFSKGIRLREGMRMTTLGFAGIDGNGLSPELLKIDSLRYIPNQKCTRVPELADKVTSTMLCGFAGRGGPCEGMIHTLCLQIWSFPKSRLCGGVGDVQIPPNRHSCMNIALHAHSILATKCEVLVFILLCNLNVLTVIPLFRSQLIEQMPDLNMPSFTALLHSV